MEGDIAHQPLLVPKNTRMITVSCGINIAAVCFTVSSQSTRVTDRLTDGQTNGQTDGQNYDPQDRASIAATRGKKQTCNNRKITSTMTVA